VTEEDSNLPQLPKGWIWTRLGEILGFVKGKKPKKIGAKDASLTVPYVDIEAFEERVINRFTDAENCPRCTVNDILIVWDGARCGLVGRGTSGAIGSTLAKLVCYELNSSYLFYFLQSKYRYINSKPRGVGIPHVEPTLFCNIQFPLPPLSEQGRIVAKVEELFTLLDAGAESLLKVKRQLKRYRQAVLKYAFEGKLTEEWRKTHKNQTEPAQKLLEHIRQGLKENETKLRKLTPVDTHELPHLPEGWIWIRLGEIGQRIQYGTSEKAGTDSNGIPVLRMGNIQDGKLIFEDLKYFPLEWCQLEDFVLEDGDVLFNRTNSAELVGKTAVYKKHHPKAAFASYLIRVRTVKGAYHPDVLAHFINSFGRRYIASVISQQVGQANVNGTKLSQMPIPFMPFEEQQKIIEEIERNFSVADEIEKTVERNLKLSQQLRQVILKTALEGKLVPQDPSDEPAEKLLERIKKERAEYKTQESIKIRSGRKETPKQVELSHYVK
jgi:type I restriction enzyme S subunit